MGCKCSKESDEVKEGERGAAAQETTELKKTKRQNGGNKAAADNNASIPNNSEQVQNNNENVHGSSDGQVENMSLENTLAVIDASLLYLRKCNDYSTDEAWQTINQLAVTSCVISSIDAEQRIHLAGHLVKVEFSQLFVKIVTSLHDDVNNRGTHREESLKVIKGTCTNFCNSDECQCLVLDLVRHGTINMLLKEVSELDVSYTDKDLLRVGRSLDILSNCVRCPDGIVRAAYRSANAVPILLRCLKSNEIKLKMECLSLLAYIVNDKESDLLANTEGCIGLLVEMLKKAATAKYYYVHYSFAGEPCGIGVYALIDTINRLVINDSAKREVVARGGVPTMMHILQIQSTTAVDSQQAALETLWKLAFVDSHRQIVIQQVQNTSGVETVVRNMQTSTHPALRDASTGLLWKLGLVDIHRQLDVDKDRAEPNNRRADEALADAGQQEHILLSCNRGDEKQVTKLRNRLKESGFNVRSDVDNVEGTLLSSMAEAVENAAVVVVCCSLKFKESVYCLAEASYACELRIPIIPVVVEEDYAADGWLEAMIAQTDCKMFHAYSDAVLNGDYEDLTKELGQRGLVKLK